VVLAVLLVAGVGFAAVSSSLSSDGGGSPATGNAPVASSPAPTTASAWLGVHTMNAGGAMVVEVIPGSPADVAGLQLGDVITQIGNRPVQVPADLEAALAGMHAGQQVEIQYERGPISATTQATLRARPANGP
jgi:putative serine protease PepD